MADTKFYFGPDIDNEHVFGPGGFDGDRGCWDSGHSTANYTDYITISTTGNASDFITALYDNRYKVMLSNGGNNRGLNSGGINGNDGANHIEYFNILVVGATGVDFGDLTCANSAYSCGTASNGSNDRGIWMGIYSASQSPIHYVTISTTGDSIDFGDHSFTPCHRAAGCSNMNMDRMISVGSNTSPYTQIDYITMSTTGDATDFGDLTSSATYTAAYSNGDNNRGCRVGSTRSPTNTIDYVTICTTGNATDFGDLSLGRRSAAGLSNMTSNRGILAGGYAGDKRTIDYVNIVSPGNATDFGDCSRNTGTTGMGCSNSN